MLHEQSDDDGGSETHGSMMQGGGRKTIIDKMHFQINVRVVDEEECNCDWSGKMWLGYCGLQKT